MSDVGECELSTTWPLTPGFFIDQENSLGDTITYEAVAGWLAKVKNTEYYDKKEGAMTRKILKGMFPEDLQVSFVFSNESKGRNKRLMVKFEGTRTYKLILEAVCKAHGSTAADKVEKAARKWWYKKTDRTKEWLRMNPTTLEQYGTDDMDVIERHNLWEKEQRKKNGLIPEMFIFKKKPLKPASPKPLPATRA